MKARNQGLGSNPLADTQKWITKSTASEASDSPSPFDTEHDRNSSEDGDNLISLMLSAVTIIVLTYNFSMKQK